MNKKITSFILLLIGTSLLYTAVRFSILEPNAFKGYEDFLNVILKTAQRMAGIITEIGMDVSIEITVEHHQQHALVRVAELPFYELEWKKKQRGNEKRLVGKSNDSLFGINTTDE